MPRLSKIGAAALAAFGWTSGGASAVTASYLAVAGGGAGGGTTSGSAGGGGGGAGGLLSGTTSLNQTLSYTVTVGAGGAGVLNASGSAGSNSVFGAIATAIGGGYGSRETNSGGNGGSGGGRSGTTGVAGTGTSGQGNNGGTATGDSGGGGGGASTAGGNGGNQGTSGGSGGNGSASSISGSSVTYAGGGGGGLYTSGSGGTGGNGGGGNGTVGAGNGNPGTVNLGGGGGGSGSTASGGPFTGGNGGSGVVIISYPAPQQFGGGVVTLSGGNVIHTFTTSGILSPISPLSASYLIVAGGGGGGGAGTSAGGRGGGGAGGMLTGSGVAIDTNSTYVVTVGSGGAGGASSGANGVNGTNSVLSIVATTALGGGFGGADSGAAGTGGSGGGQYGNSTAGAGTAGQGNNGSNNGGNSGGGGGGGAGAVGGQGGGNPGGNGGVGLASSISGTSTYYAGGGGGAGYNGAANGTGGNGGGGNGGNSGAGTVTAGTVNTGGGGGGGGGPGGTAGGNGGSGIVIISYAGSVQQMAGGTVTIVGGNVIHTFTSSGYLTPLTYYSNSLRFRASNSAYLSRTPTVQSNTTTWTWSGWVKRGRLNNENYLFGGTTDSYNVNWHITSYNSSSNALYVQGYAGSQTYIATTNALFRDPAAWYHVVVAFDTTQATDTNRIKVYVNGVQQTFSSASYPSQNTSTFINRACLQTIGNNGTNTHDGEMTAINFIDGQQLTPNSFGTFNSYGVWQPITYGGSYGTNGFYLPFNTNGTGYVASFNGTNQRVTTPAMTSLTGDFTVEFFCNNTGFASGPVDSTVICNYPATSTTSEILVIQRQTTGQWGVYCGSLSGAGNLTWTPAITSQSSWVHVALVRSGTTVTAYYNGVAVASATVSSTITLPSGTSLGGYTNGANLFVGSISNLRITTNAVYTSNFTPPTTSLTAISGTVLLTLQSSTIVDNSTNAYTLTNVNSVTTGLSYPFAINVFKDQGPAGNNWVPNNISGTFGSTLDYMTDVPTLTSATAANYATLNPLFIAKQSSWTLSNGNLQAKPNVSGAGYTETFATIPVTTAKIYAEFIISATGSAGIHSALGMGINNSPNTFQGTADLALTQAGTGYYLGLVTGSKNDNSGTYSYGSAIAVNDVIMFAFDGTNGKIYWGKNGTWFASGDPAAGTNPAFSSIASSTWFVGLQDYSATNYPATWQSNFGQQPFTYTPPSGYVALNTYNM